MKCQTCGQTNRTGAAFCRHCGRLLLSECPRCRAAVEQPANFCDTCGAPLGPAAWTGAPAPVATPPPVPRFEPAEAAPPAPGLALERFIPRELLNKLTAARQSGTMNGERRVVTMLFCDIKGSTSLAEGLDPEEWTEVVNGVFEHMVRPVYKYEGTVARLTGDGLLAFFGAPIAHEDDPSRAVLAALEIVSGVHAYRETLSHGPRDLDVRVGLNTGLVVVGAIGSNLRLEYSALGDAINVAARMEQTAEPGTVQITGETLKLVNGLFDVEPLGGISVKGKSSAVPAYRVLRRRAGGQRRAHPIGQRAALVNRTPEWDLLSRAFDALGGGRGAIVFLSGEAGLGKTRLLEEAVDRLGPLMAQRPQVIQASAFSFEAGEPFGLVIRLMRRVLDLMAGDPPEVARARVQAAVGDDGEAVQVLETLFGVAAEADDVSGEGFSGRLAACLERYWSRAAVVAPVIMVLDDLQWADASSVDLLTKLLSLAETKPALFLCGLRPERRSHGWRLRDAADHDHHIHFSESQLVPLSDGDSRALLSGLMGLAGLPDTLTARILDHAEGNPLFIEEVVLNLIERGHLTRASDDAPWTAAVPVESIELPNSLQALLTARVDRLDDDARRTLQIASVIGRGFPLTLLRVMADQPEELERHLLDLQRAELIREVARQPEPEYAFNHTVTQQATYSTILLKDRRRLHRRVAENVERLRADARPAVAHVLAHHYLEAGEEALALPYLAMAAQAALHLNATAEAITHVERALPHALALHAPSRQIADLYAMRGRALELESRFEEADATYAEMERLALERGDGLLELESIIAQGKLRANVTSLHDPMAGRELMQRALAIAESLDDRGAEVRILWNLVNIARFDRHELDKAGAIGKRALAIAHDLGLEEETAYLLNDLGDIYGTLGEMDEAQTALREAQDRWRALGNEPMLADSLTNGAAWHAIMGELAGGLAEANEAYAISERIGNPWGLAYSRAVRGMIHSLLGNIGESVAELRAAIDLAHQAGFVGGQILARSFLANVYSWLGQIEASAALAEEGVALGREQLPQFATMCLSRLFFARLAQGQLEEAIRVIEDPILAADRPMIFIQFDLFIARIALALAQGHPDHAIDQYEDGLRRLRSYDARAWLPELLDWGATALEAAGRMDEALEAVSAAAALARDIGERGTLWMLLAHHWQLLERAGDAAKAAAVLAEARSELAFVAGNTWPDDLRRAFLDSPAARRLAGT
jgi:class 3 adenylate cyclase/tetratricopeptide (TPR) repeat protein